MRRINLAGVGVLLAVYLLCSSSIFAQGGRGILAADPKNANRPYDKHDISGIWSRNGSPGGYGGGGTCRDCGDRGYSNPVPALTPLRQKIFDANKPSYGRNLCSSEAAAHPEEAIGRRRAVPPASGSDPYQTCNPMGPSRALIYPDPLEMNDLRQDSATVRVGKRRSPHMDRRPRASQRSRHREMVGILSRQMGWGHFRSN